MDNPNFDPLDADYRDQLATIGKAATSLVPLVGGVLGELIGTVVPSQRLDRIASYLRQVEARLATLEVDLKPIFDNPEKVDLIEEGAYQSARATTSERIDRIASLVVDGLTSDESELVRRKRLAGLLREIDDDELTLLNAYGQSYGGVPDSSIWDKVNRPDPAHLQSSRTEIDSEKLFEAGKSRLLRLGLLQKRYQSPKRGEQPIFDTKKGDFKHSMEVSYLGRMLLGTIGLPSPYDAEDGDE